MIPVVVCMTKTIFKEYCFPCVCAKKLVFRLNCLLLLWVLQTRKGSDASLGLISHSSWNDTV